MERGWKQIERSHDQGTMEKQVRFTPRNTINYEIYSYHLVSTKEFHEHQPAYLTRIIRDSPLVRVASSLSRFMNCPRGPVFHPLIIPTGLSQGVVIPMSQPPLSMQIWCLFYWLSSTYSQCCHPALSTLHTFRIFPQRTRFWPHS